MKDWLAGVLIRAGLNIASDVHAYWAWRLQTLYWESPRGMALRRQLGVDDFTKEEIERVIANAEASGEVVWPEQDGESRSGQ